MRFGYGCPHGHEVIEAYAVGKAPESVRCTEHDALAERIFEPFWTQEDRRGMSSSTPGKPGWSWALGAPMPTSRAEMRAIEKTQGIEFITPSEARADVQKLKEGKNLDEPRKLEKGYLAKAVAARGIRFDRSLTPKPLLTREQSEQKLKDERGWDSKVEFEAKVSPTAKLPM